MTQLDQDSGWCGVFWQRDPDGMHACLDGREVPPWDVVESLIQDLAAERGNWMAGPETVQARSLHAASLAAYDARPGGREALGDRLDVMLREQRYAAERQAELGRLLRDATSPDEGEALRLDLAWASDDQERATARCAELRSRIATVDRLWTGAESFTPDGQVQGPARPAAPDDTSARQHPAAPESSAGPARPGAGHSVAAGRSIVPDDWFRPEDEERPRSGPSAAGQAQRHDGPARPSEGAHGSGAPDRAASGGYGPGPVRDGSASAGGYGPRPAGGGSASAGGYGPGAAGGGSASAGGYGPGAAGGGSASPGGYAPAATGNDPASAGAHRPGGTGTGTAPQPANRSSETVQADNGGKADARNAEPRKAETRTKRRRGSARFAGMEAEPDTAAGPAIPLPAMPAPAATGGTPRGARFAGAAQEDSRQAQAQPLDAEVRRAVSGAVESLVRLRAEGRSGEAHAVLVEAAYWPAAHFPLLAAELHHAGLGADWATLLWETASLPPDRLVAAADALSAAGRTSDSDQILRQGVVRPAREIGGAVVVLVDEGRHREARVLLDAYVRVRTPEEAARSAQSDPGLLVPLLLDAARGVSDERHWDLVHALRVAGLSA
ncbi:hypothetical protein ABT009_13335 [Streptomyces sp. NPDC002896]|uniref:hypothetical protein n=1 Tax=Streptomyces sp. NPDC002896 TaxID=3154438 RepID=UPI003327D142